MPLGHGIDQRPGKPEADQAAGQLEHDPKPKLPTSLPSVAPSRPENGERLVAVHPQDPAYRASGRWTPIDLQDQAHHCF